mgnify:CR=1 FL=1
MILTRRYWKCDRCGTERKITGDAGAPPLPKGWSYLDHGYGNTTEACEDADCQAWLEELASPYGYCPKCGARGVLRERCLNGNDTCQNSHVYPSREAVMRGANDGS